MIVILFILLVIVGGVVGAIVAMGGSSTPANTPKPVAPVIPKVKIDNKEEISIIE